MKRVQPARAGASMLKTAELLEQLERSVHEASKVGGEFCLVDIDAAMTMLDRAHATQDAETRTRNQRNARKAFEVISSLASRLALEPEQETTIRERLAILGARLREAGA